MAVIKVRHNQPFTTVANEVINQLEIDELGALVKMLQLPPDWDFNNEMLQDKLNVGRDKLQAIVKRLRGIGVLRHVARRENGRLNGWIWEVAPFKMFDNPVSEPEKQSTGFSGSQEKQSIVFSDTLKNRQTENTVENIKENSSQNKISETKETFMPDPNSANSDAGVQNVSDKPETAEQPQAALDTAETKTPETKRVRNKKTPKVETKDSIIQDLHETFKFSLADLIAVWQKMELWCYNRNGGKLEGKHKVSRKRFVYFIETAGLMAESDGIAPNAPQSVAAVAASNGNGINKTAFEFAKKLAPMIASKNELRSILDFAVQNVKFGGFDATELDAALRKAVYDADGRVDTKQSALIALTVEQIFKMKM